MTTAIRSRYEPRAQVGAGGQGVVLCARDLVHDRLVAVKVRHARSSAEREELLAEARTLLNLRPHPGVPLVREDFFANGRYHIVMDWVEGVDLEQLLKRAGPGGLPYPRLLDYLTQVADALDHLHGHEPPIVHKDVKPANIVVDAGGRAVLVDFGISTATGRSQGRSGTPGYIAPEVSAGGRGCPASDVFSLAATAYFAFTGEQPEPGAHPRWRGVPDALIPRLEVALGRGLAIDPNRRPPSARAFVEMLGPGAIPNNLPASLTRFVGRHHELAEVARALSQTRLLTLVGSGGIGKTRLANELGTEVAWRFPDGVWLVELATVSADYVTNAIANVLGVREEPGRTLLDALTHRLRDRQVLLLLDNCEHVLDAAAYIAEELLKNAAGLRIVATSRQSLDVFGELVHRLPTLSFPEPGTDLDVEQLAGYEAVELLRERAQLAQPGFRLDPQTVSDVAAVCAVLDGIPLALEMAAGRLRELSLPELRASLSDALEFRGSRTAPSRQRTLAATAAWSYDLLRPSEATLFRRLSVFAGSFSSDAVSAVCAGNGAGHAEVDGMLQSLVDRSMVVPLKGDDSDPRYRLLESLRLFGRERCNETGELASLVDRHVAWFLDAAEGVHARLFGPDESRVLSRLEVDYDNLRLALANALDGGNREQAVRLGVALSRFWNVRGYWAEGRGWLEAALSGGDQVPQALRAKALTCVALMAERQGDFRGATEFAEQAMRLAREVGDRTTAAEALDSLSSVAQERGETELADSLLEECLAEWRASMAIRGVVSSFAGALGEVGWKAAWRADYPQAAQFFNEALAMAGELGIGRARSYALLGLAAVAEAEGRLEDAHQCVVDASLISERLGDRRFLGVEAYMRGLLALDQGDVYGAEVEFLAALHEATESGYQILVIRSIEGMARVAGDDGRLQRAATLFGAAASIRAKLPWPVAPADLRWYERATTRIRDALGAPLYDRSWSEGQGLTSDEAVRLARDQSIPQSVQDRCPG